MELNAKFFFFPHGVVRGKVMGVIKIKRVNCLGTSNVLIEFYIFLECELFCVQSWNCDISFIQGKFLAF